MRLGDISIERQVHLLCAVHWDKGFSSLPWHWQVHQTIQLVNIISNDFRHPRFSCILHLVLPNIWDSLREKSTNMAKCQFQCSLYPALCAKITWCWHFNFSRASFFPPSSHRHPHCCLCGASHAVAHSCAIFLFYLGGEFYQWLPQMCAAPPNLLLKKAQRKWLFSHPKHEQNAPEKKLWLDKCV